MAVTAVPRLVQLLGPVVAATGHDLEDLSVTPAGRRRVVRVVVDRDGGVSLDDVADVARAVGEALDDIDAREPALLDGAYVLEVSSPGVDRPLTEARHWRRNVGRLVTVVPVGGGTELTGRLTAADGDAVLVDGVQLALADVVRGQVQVEFNRGAGAPGDTHDAHDGDTGSNDDPDDAEDRPEEDA